MGKKIIITIGQLVLALLPFILFGEIYDLMRYLPNYMVNPIDTRDLFEAEKALFGITTAEGTLIPGQWFQLHHCAAADLFAGISYLLWVPLPVLYGIWLFFSGKRRLAFRFSAAFLFVNLVGFVFYYIYPAAPPWYVLNYGFEVDFSTPGNVGELIRFDNLIGMPVFQSIYCHNSNVFAAVPSLHSAYIPVAFFYAFFRERPRNRYWLTAMVIFMFGIWFTAVYSTHHYVIDVLLGILCVIIGISIFEFILPRFKVLRRNYQAYCRLLV